MSDTYVKSFTHLKDRPKAAQALAQLQRLASLMKPIMRKHGWTLPVLSEFFPDNPSLVGLNVNHGQKILVRLRPAWAPDTFYDEEQIVGTMLHELTHNVHGPHDDKFYKLLGELQDEYDALKRSGYSGEGFYSKGHRLGTNVSHNVPPHQARQKAAAAADQRLRMGAVLGGGGRLGGAVRRGLTPRELAAEAAERRLRDEKACGQGAVAQAEAAKAAKESAETVVDIDLTLDDGDDDDVIIVDQPALPSSSSVPPKAAIPQHKPTAAATALPAPSLFAAGPSRSVATSSNLVTPMNPGPELPASWTCPTCTVLNDPASLTACTVCETPRPTPEWPCPTCTLLNAGTALRCAACDTSYAGAVLPRPSAPALKSKLPVSNSESGWTCHVCGEVGMPNDFWTCRFCGTVKRSS